MGEAFDKGKILYEQRRFAQAREQFLAELREDRDCVASRVMLSASCLQDDLLDEAKRWAHEALAIDPDDAEAHAAMARYWLMKPVKVRSFALSSAEGQRRSNMKQARQHAKLALAADPDCTIYHSLVAQIEWVSGNLHACRRAADAGLAINPNDVECLQWRAETSNAFGADAEADEELTHALCVDPLDAETHRARGWLSLQRGDHVLALDHFKSSLSQDPGLRSSRIGARVARAAEIAPIRWTIRLLLWLVSYRMQPALCAAFLLAIVGWSVYHERLEYDVKTSVLLSLGQFVGVLIIGAVITEVVFYFRRKLHGIG